MLTYIVIGPSKYGTFAAGYYRPGRPTEFVPVTTGLPSEKEAFRECSRLAGVQRARSTPEATPHHLRAYGRGAFAIDLEYE